jgi:hypothetical protein
MATESPAPGSGVHLPPLPEPFTRLTHPTNPPRPVPGGDLFSSEQVCEYARQAVLAERARCIAACEKVSKDLYEYAEANNYHGDAWSYIEQCIAAIRAGRASDKR